MIPSTCGKKIGASDFYDVTSILTKGIVIFYWRKMVKIIMVAEKQPKIYEWIFYNIFLGSALPPPRKDNCHILSVTFQ